MQQGVEIMMTQKYLQLSFPRFLINRLTDRKGPLDWPIGGIASFTPFFQQWAATYFISFFGGHFSELNAPALLQNRILSQFSMY